MNWANGRSNPLRDGLRFGGLEPAGLGRHLAPDPVVELHRGGLVIHDLDGSGSITGMPHAHAHVDRSDVHGTRLAKAAPEAKRAQRPRLENPELNRQFLTRIPLGRWGEPADIGALVVHLCRPEAGFMTGTDLVVDGGWLAQ
jgi:hypothetical protein